MFYKIVSITSPFLSSKLHLVMHLKFFWNATILTLMSKHLLNFDQQILLLYFRSQHVSQHQVASYVQVIRTPKELGGPPAMSWTY